MCRTLKLKLTSQNQKTEAMEDSYEFIWVDGSAVAGEENFVKWFNDTEEHQPV